MKRFNRALFVCLLALVLQLSEGFFPHFSYRTCVESVNSSRRFARNSADLEPLRSDASDRLLTIFEKRATTAAAAFCSATLALSLLLYCTPAMSVAMASEAPAAAKVKVYKSGKNPDPPKDGSKAGTKKETGFLRCMSNCKAQCQKPGEGLAKNDCVQDCQDQCCDSYEQCSFKIKINTGTDI